MYIALRNKKTLWSASSTSGIVSQLDAPTRTFARLANSSVAKQQKKPRSCVEPLGLMFLWRETADGPSSYPLKEREESDKVIALLQLPCIIVGPRINVGVHVGSAQDLPPIWTALAMVYLRPCDLFQHLKASCMLPLRLCPLKARSETSNV